MLAYTGLLVGKHLLDVLTGEGLGALEWRPKCAVPDELCSDAKGTRYTEEDGVEFHLVKSDKSGHGVIVNVGKGHECVMSHTRSR